MIDAQYSPFRGIGGRYINYKQMKQMKKQSGLKLFCLLPVQ